ncbi:sodium:solute symporter family protein [Streptoalloteichus hindustanus]|uniref:Solute carrier family 5 (High affinity choline transporter), member 7 n=1 Tax=Streptoalloteichus hindustanus TaxID=2017 RepID=A0A1M5HBP9_STRHI|nr:sodium:solute symporter family protein [Streptoalloteichus hindustanus]SHG13410.1 solute carrier family 5 (high affinity choline transporter), member 7 [Streptoalloteichus hindustanus]
MSVPATSTTEPTPSDRAAAGRGPSRLITLGVFGLGLAAAAVYIALTQPRVSWPALLAMFAFYGVFYWLGAVVAARRASNLAETLVAGRSLPLWIGVCTMTATWVDGGYISGTAEATASRGLVFAQAPWGYALSMLVGGLFFAGPMRRGRFMTMLDPMDIRFGKRVAGLGSVPAVLGEVFWSGAILTALGTTFAVIVGLDFTPAIIISAAIGIAYTVAGGAWSVALTDVAQIVVIFVGLFLALPFAAGAVGGLGAAWDSYSANLGGYASLFPPLTGWDDPAWGPKWWNWWDMGLLLVMGGIPWQVYFQRVLSSKDERTARRLSFAASGLCVVAAIPPALFGVIASAADFTAHGAPPMDNPALTVPYVLRYLLPTAVAIVALGAMAAAVMSSVDASILSAASMGGWNLYRRLVNPKAGDERVRRVVRRVGVLVGAAATVLALNVGSVYQLWYLASDLVYVLLFPMLVCALFVPFANRTGVLSGFAVGLLLRVSGGEPTFGLPALLPWPWQEDGAVLFPFRTVAMVAGLATTLAVSRLTRRADPPVPLSALRPDSPERRAIGLASPETQEVTA